jgi:hypothetical protein
MEERFELAVIEFIEGYKKVLQKKGNTLRYTIKNIYLLLEDRYLWGEGLHIFIDMVENRKDELPVGKLLKDIYVTNLIPENYPLDSYEEKGLEIIEGLAIEGQDYLGYKLIEYGEGKVVYNSLVKFMLAYDKWQTRNYQRYVLNEEDIGYGDPDLYYWLDVADGEATSFIPPSERYSIYDVIEDEFKPLYKKKSEFVCHLVTFIDLVLESDAFSMKQKMALTDLYAQYIEQFPLNSSFVYGQLALLSNQIKHEFSRRKIRQDKIEERIHTFYHKVPLSNFEICKIDFSNYHPDCCYIVYVDMQNGLFNDIFAKRLKYREKEFLLCFEKEEFRTSSIAEFMNLLFNDILDKCDISKLQMDKDELKKETDVIHQQQIQNPFDYPPISDDEVPF